MKTYTIIGAKSVKTQSTLLKKTGTDVIAEGDDEMSICDGFHTMEELYDHRIALWIAYCSLAEGLMKANESGSAVWRSKKHSDGSTTDGWFILGMNHTKGKQITYHLPMSKWDETDFAMTYDEAPELDGHTSHDVLKRIPEL